MFKFDYETLLLEIGGFGTFQKLQLLLICLIYIPLGFFVFIPVFAYPTVPHRCQLPFLDKNDNSSIRNLTVLRQFIPVLGNQDSSKKDVEMLSQCTRNIMPAAKFVTEIHGLQNTSMEQNETRFHATENCKDGWVYQYPEEISTVVTEFDLVCESSWKRPFLTMGLMIGFLIGSMAMGPISDRFGRRKICLIALAGYATFLLGFSLSPNYELLLLFDVLIGVVHVTLYACLMVLGQEIVDSSHRAFVSAAVNISFTIGYMILPVMAFLVVDWRWLTRALGLAVALFFPYYWFLLESPRWLLSRERNKEATQLIKRIAQTNGTTEKLEAYFNNGNNERDYSENNEYTPDQRKLNKRRKSSIHILATNSIMRKRSVILSLVWNVSYLCYYTLGLNTSNLGGNKYVNCFIAAALDIPCFFTVMFFVQKIGRRSSLAASFALAGAFCLLTALFTSPFYLAVTFAMIGKFFATATMGIIFLFTSELYPTMLRNTGLGLAATSSRVGSIASPFLVYAGENSTKEIPFYVMAALSLLTACLTLLLPETKQSSLPETMVEATDLESFRLSMSCKKGGGTEDTPEELLESLNNNEVSTVTTALYITELITI